MEMVQIQDNIFVNSRYILQVWREWTDTFLRGRLVNGEEFIIQKEFEDSFQGRMLMSLPPLS